MARLLRFAAVAVLLGGATAGLSGCTGDADPVASPSPSVTAESPSPTPSASPSPTALSEEELLELIPEDARAENFAAASNFAKFFIAEYHQMFLSKDDALFAALSEPGCVFCENSLAEYEEVIGSGGSLRGGDMVIEDGLAAGGNQGDGTTNASFGLEVAVVEYLDSSGAVVKTIPATSGRVGVFMRYDVDHWVVIEVGSDQA